MSGNQNKAPGFTPGPWHNRSTNSGYTSRYVCGPKHPDGGDYTPICIANSEANANLIAAAPEMYEALKLAMSRVHDLEIIIEQARELGMTLFMCGDQWPEWKKKIDGALAKAEGRQS